MFTRRLFFASALATAALANSAHSADVGGDGLHKEAFFEDTFLDFSEDLADARAQGKSLMILIEQRGCPYCTELHEVNFAKEQIRTLIEDKFYVVQLDMWGAREVTDINGEAMEERNLIVKKGINFTPTVLFYSSDEADGNDEIFRMPGYFKPFHFITGLEYVSQHAFKDQTFQRYLQVKFDGIAAKGEKPNVW